MTPPKRTKSPPPSIYSAPLHPRSASTAILFELTSIPRGGGFLYLKDTTDPTCLSNGRTSACCAWGAKPRGGLGRVPPPHTVGFRALSLQGSPFPWLGLHSRGNGPWARLRGPGASSGLRLPPQDRAATYTRHAPPGGWGHLRTPTWQRTVLRAGRGQGTARQRARVALRVAPRQASPPLQLFVS